MADRDESVINIIDQAAGRARMNEMGLHATNFVLSRSVYNLWRGTVQKVGVWKNREVSIQAG